MPWRGGSPSLRVTPLENCTHLSVFTGVGPHQCGRTSELRPQGDACSSSRRSTVRTSISSTQDASNCRKDTRNLYQTSREPSDAKCDSIWRHKTHLIPSAGNVSVNPPTGAPSNEAVAPPAAPMTSAGIDSAPQPSWRL